MRSLRLALSAALAVGTLAVIGVTPASGGPGPATSYTIRKVVQGTAPSGFAVSFECRFEGQDPPDPPDSAGTVAFTPTGTPTGAAPVDTSIQGDAWVLGLGTPESDITCTFTETTNAGAASTSFTCTSVPEATCSAPSGEAATVSVVIIGGENGDAEITFTNVFPAEAQNAAADFAG
jgi:hypothetical protein